MTAMRDRFSYGVVAVLEGVDFGEVRLVPGARVQAVRCVRPALPANLFDTNIEQTRVGTKNTTTIDCFDGAQTLEEEVLDRTLNKG